MTLIDGFYKKHPSLRKIVLISYELAIGIMLYIALHYANDAYALGAKDCLNYYDRIINTSFFPPDLNGSVNCSVMNGTVYCPSLEIP
jgi:hypothetical protein